METMCGKNFFDPDGPPLCVFRMPLHESSRSVHGHDCHEQSEGEDGSLACPDEALAKTDR